MTTAGAAIAQELLKQSILVGVLAIGAYFFYNDNRKMIEEYRQETREEIKILRDDVKDCNSRNEHILRNQIDKNNEALNRIEDCLNPRRR
jgi:flagellar biosynthesis/type III secretory pathway chaperone